MKILLNVRWPVGGIRTYLRYVYRRFPADEYSFTLLAPFHNELEILKNDLGRRLKEVVVSTPTVGYMSGKIIKMLRSEKYDLVHSHGLSAGLLAALPVKISNVPHVVTLHDVFLNKMFSGYKGRTKKLAINYGLRLPNVIHILGDDPKNNFSEFFPNLAQRFDKIEIINSGIEVERFSVKSNSVVRSKFRADNNIPCSVSVLGFFGRFMAQKGFATLVDAIELLLGGDDKANVPIVVAFGEGGFLNREIRMLEERGLTNQFRFLPFVPNIADAMSKMDGVVMPSRWEAVGLVAMEALVLGVPLLASDCLGLREVTKDTPALTFPADAPSPLAKVIKGWAKDPRKGDFEAFAPFAASRFDVRNTATKLQRLYARLAHGLPIENLGKTS